VREDRKLYPGAMLGYFFFRRWVCGVSSWSIDRRHRFLELPIKHQTLFYAGKELLAFTDERLGRAVSTTDNHGARGIRN